VRNPKSVRPMFHDFRKPPLRRPTPSAALANVRPSLHPLPPDAPIERRGPASDAQRHYVQFAFNGALVRRLTQTRHLRKLDIMFCCALQLASQRGGAGGGGAGNGWRVAVRESPARRLRLRSAPACAGLAIKVSGAYIAAAPVASSLRAAKKAHS
jgi:hypothetical protein